MTERETLKKWLDESSNSVFIGFADGSFNGKNSLTCGAYEIIAEIFDFNVGNGKTVYCGTSHNNRIVFTVFDFFKTSTDITSDWLKNSIRE